jgi:hypothetical protein
MPRSLPPELRGAGSVARVGLESSGGTVVLTVGLRLVVTLAAHWTPPKARAAGWGVTAELQPLRVVSSAGFPAPGVASATFMAVRPGTAAIFAVTDYPCRHTTPMCAVPQREFMVTVRVLPATGTGGGPLPKPAAP